MICTVQDVASLVQGENGTGLKTRISVAGLRQSRKGVGARDRKWTGWVKRRRRRKKEREEKVEEEEEEEAA